MSAVTSQPQPKLLSLAWPIFVEQALRMLIGTVDTFMVSHVSDGAVAALGVANQLIVLFIIIFNFVGIGASIVITHHLGAKDHVGARAITKNAIAVNTWLGLIASVLVCSSAAWLLRRMQLPESLMPYGLPFLSLMGGTLFLEAIGMSIAATLRANKFTRDAMYVAVGQNCINVLGNCITLFGLFGCPKLGVAGVALSGVVSRICSCVALWILLNYRTHLRLTVVDFLRVQRSKVRRILRLGLPAAGENLCYWLAFMLVTTFVAQLGADSLATQSYTLQLQRLVMLFSISIGLGTEILIGHLVGAGQFDAAYEELLRSLRTGLGFAAGAIVVVALCAPLLIRCFTHNPVIIASSIILLRLAIPLEIGRVFNVVVINSLRATGDVGFPIQMAVLSMWLVWVPLAWFLGIKLGWGLSGIWIAMAIDEWTRGVLMYRRWKLKRWVKHAHRSRAHLVPDYLASPESV
jgi:putative MATE family efflux protein